MKTMIKILLPIMLCVLIALGAFTIVKNKDLYQFKPVQNFIGKISIKETPKIPPFESPKIEAKYESHVYIHKQGFDINKDLYKDVSEQTVKKDNEGRISEISTLISADSNAEDLIHILYQNEMTRNSSLLYLQKTIKYAVTYNVPVIFVLSYEYDGADTQPSYMHIKAYSKDDKGTSLDYYITTHLNKLKIGD
jgi:hypothetical protein